ncbi:ferrous iron transport protein B [Streptomyces xanthochromogenes]|uniref:ferrous iron transport protein B n=1 Tax=Streptomyces TaxID=1883 RepID=UPI00136F68B7|nr:ferrous iron transport protein B [Streptomyces sp. SID1034]
MLDSARRTPKSCCGDGSSRTDSDAGAARVALVGNPNTGKSTLFNALTGARQRVGNWPGKTVEVAWGSWRTGDAVATPVALVDLPGTYSLVPHSPDEALTRDLLVDRGAEGRPHLIVVTLDAANLARNLYLLAQVKDTGIPLVVALTMSDTAAARGIEVDPRALSEAVDAPVVPVLPRERKGLDALAAAVREALADPRPCPAADLGPAVEETVRGLADLIGSEEPEVAALRPARWAAMSLLSGDEAPWATAGLRAAAAVRARALVTDHGMPGTEVPDSEPAAPCAQPSPSEHPHAEPPHEEADFEDAELVLAEGRYLWARHVHAASVHCPAGSRATWTDRIDRVLTSRWTGLPLFLGVMWAVFQATTTCAKPLQDGLQEFFSGPVTSLAVELVGDPDHGGWLPGLVVNGLVSGVGQLLSFVPLMAIMYVLLALLEDSGYFARAAFVADRLMRLLGLPGQAFLPLIVGFGCNVPALSASRVLSNRQHRLLLGMVIPFVTCSARLTVYVLLAGVFFGSSAGTVVFLMYVLSIVLVVVMGLALRRVLFRDSAREPLILELPPYRMPTLRGVALQTRQKLAGFLRTAGGIVVVTVTAVWLLSSVPAGSGRGGFGGVSVAQSLFGAVARFIAPVFSWAGFGEWHASATLVTGFVAKEAVISTMAQTYQTQDADGGAQAGALGPQLRATFEQASGGHTVPAVLAFMVFLLAYTPCMTTIAAQRTEIGGRLTAVSMGLQLAVAWALAVLVFQVGSLIA